MMEFATKGKEIGDVHYVNAPASYVVEENFGGYFDDYDDFAFAEELQNQECVYLSFQNNNHNGSNQAPSSSGSRSRNSHKSIGERNSSITTGSDEQFANDEALARELQELELDSTLNASGAGTTRAATSTTPTLSATANSGRNTARTAEVTWDDGIDPDSMSYEELERLGERIGTESRGLSDDLISCLTSWTYKTGLFSKKDKLENCAICYMDYKNRDKLMKLPCQHQYHKDCITRWLKLKKTCPVCNEEVFGS